MSETPYPIRVVRLALFALIIVVALIYSIPIIFVRRFHRSNYLLTLNFCMASLLFGIDYLISYIVLEIDRQRIYSINTCEVFMFFQGCAFSQVVFALLMVSINRLCSILYHSNRFFKQQRWVIVCVASQWTIGLLLALPMCARDQTLPFCAVQRWVSVYIVIVVVIFPSAIAVILNVSIFMYVRSSSRRVQPIPSISSMTPRLLHRPRIRSRDITLLRHVVIMLILFMGGIIPINFLGMIQTFTGQSYPLLYASLVIWMELCLLGDIINLFVYNYELREYLTRMIKPGMI